MQYQGGKSRIAKQIAAIINEISARGGSTIRYQGGKSRIALPIADVINDYGMRGGDTSIIY